MKYLRPTELIATVVAILTLAIVHAVGTPLSGTTVAKILFYCLVCGFASMGRHQTWKGFFESMVLAQICAALLFIPVESKTAAFFMTWGAVLAAILVSLCKNH